MNEIVEVPLDTRLKQATASDPSLSVWVSANAGSGKTFVLARRVIRLLLDGNDPSRLLCLTFTNAAAAEMANRVFAELGKWVSLDDVELAKVLTELTDKVPDEALIRRARALFALALDTPGGLKIQTIHAFCESLLHQFPLEANISGHFRVLEEDGQASLLAAARRQTIAAMEHEAVQSPVAGQSGTAWFATLLEMATDAQIDKALDELVKQREPFRQWTGGDVDGAMEPAWARQQMNAGMAATDIMAEALADSALDDATLEAIAKTASETGGSTNENFARLAGEYLNAGDVDTRYRLRSAIYLTQKGTARAAIITKPALKKTPEAEALLDEEKARVLAGEQRLTIWRTLKASHALFRLADAVLERYEKLKRQRGFADFDDLINATANLLLRSDVGLWVQYKLDRGIDHVLVDEAQDTSPVQWQIVNAIVADFFSGEGAARRNRTVFAVGDEKQSIYSFQGADPKEFTSQRNMLGGRSQDAGKSFKPLELHLSFRSVPDVLEAVDTVFKDAGNFRGLGEAAEGVESGTVHSAIRASHGGEVRIWPCYAKAKAPETDSWLDPPDALQGDDPQVRLANRIADTIGEWMRNDEKLPGRKEKLRSGDILILVRRRDRFVTAMVRALKERELAIAGADRLKLTEHVAIEDLMAVGRVMLMPEDDLSLAAILKSPLFGHDDDMLIRLCAKREGEPLCDHLKLLAEGGGTEASVAAGIVRRLERWRRLAQIHSVHDFYARLLGEEGGRRAMTGRLGSEAEEVIDAFMQSALEHDLQMATGLDGFLAMLDRSQPEIKRNADMKRDEIRVLTVHAAKGLEAPVVFLVDPCSKAHSASHRPAVVQSGEGAEESWYWHLSGNPVEPVAARYAQIEEAAEEEYRRLLYVGMTRAADRLIVCGYRGVNEPRHDHWHQMVSNALLPQAEERGSHSGDAEHIWRSPKPDIQAATRREVPLEETNDAGPASPEEARPDWLFSPVPAEKPLERPLSPSRAIELLQPSQGDTAPFAPSVETEKIYDDAVATGRGFALERGNAIHALLQFLPDLEPDKRDAALFGWLAAQAAHWPDEQREVAAKQVRAILENEMLENLFAPDSRAEANIAGYVKVGGKPVLVSGQIDRLAITEDEIVIADYKSNRDVPESAEDVPLGYVVQLALYRALMREIHPSKQVRGLLIWTETGSVTELPAAIMDDCLARLAQR